MKSLSSNLIEDLDTLLILPYLFCTFRHVSLSEVEMVDAATKAAVGKIPILKTKAGPRDKEAWVNRLKEEYMSLIQYVQNNKESDTDWFR